MTCTPRSLVCARVNGGWWRSSELLRKVKGSVVDFACLDDRQKVMFLLDEISSGTTSKKKRGIDGLEEMLDALGCGGTLDADMRRSLIELGAARNVIVHGHGRVDRRFAEQCPWWPAAEDHRLRLSNRRLGLYRMALIYYSHVVGARMQEIGIWSSNNVSSFAVLRDESLKNFKAALAVPEPSEGA